MKNLKRLSRNDLRNLSGGTKCEQMRGGFSCDDSDVGGDSCKMCVSCSNRQGSESCYTDPGGNCAKAKQMAQSLC